MFFTAALIVVFAFAVALLWPAKYRAAGTILIEQQEVPEDFVRSAISSYADQRVQVIGQRVMTSTNLLAIIKKFQLYPEHQGEVTRESLVDRVRKDITLDMISADVVDPRLGRATKATIAFSVGFSSPSATQASGVANELVSLYLSENVQSRQQLSQGTATFLADEASKLNDNVAQLEHKISDFKEANGQSLPEFTQINLQLMNRRADELHELEARQRLLDQQIVYLDGQLAQVKPTTMMLAQDGQRILTSADRLKLAQTEYATASANYSPNHPTLMRLKREIEGLEKDVKDANVENDIERSLSDARTQLAAARKKYSPLHPDVMALERRVASLENTRATISKTSGAVARNAPTEPDNPAYIQLQSQRIAAINERDSLTSERSELKAQVASYEDRLARAPAVERDYNALNRDMQNEQAKYADVKQKQLQAQLSANMETEQKGERFTLIEPPITPEEPVSPNRRAILALGIVLSIAAAFGIMMLLESMDTRIRGREAILSLLQVPPLAVIGWVQTPDERRARRKKLRNTAVALGSISLVALLVAVLIMYVPMDDIWSTVARRFGVVIK